MLEALDYCHARRAVHRNIKPQNIMVDARGVLKLAGFRVARTCVPHCDDPKLTSPVGTLWYRAPELILGMKPYTSQVDVWSAACIIGEMALQVSTRILGRRTAPFPPFLIHHRVPHGFTPRS